MVSDVDRRSFVDDESAMESPDDRHHEVRIQHVLDDVRQRCLRVKGKQGLNELDIQVRCRSIIKIRIFEKKMPVQAHLTNAYITHRCNGQEVVQCCVGRSLPQAPEVILKLQDSSWRRKKQLGTGRRDAWRSGAWRT